MIAATGSTMRPIGHAARSRRRVISDVRAPGLRVGALARFARRLRQHANYHGGQQPARHDAPGIAGFAREVRDAFGVRHLAMRRERDRRAIGGGAGRDAAGETADGERRRRRRAGAEVPRAGAAELHGDRQAHAAVERRAHLLSAKGEFGDHGSARLLHDRAAVPAGAMRDAAEEAVEHGRQLRFDVGHFDELLVELVAAVLAVPLEAVAFARRGACARSRGPRCWRGGAASAAC